MKIKKTILSEQQMAYAVSIFDTDDGTKAVMASEGLDGCKMMNLDGSGAEQVWTNAGGTMTICQMDRTGNFLAVQNFFKGFQSKTACIVKCRRTRDGWTTEKFIELPYVHRICITEAGGKRYLLAATLCRNKEFREDWSTKGQVFIGELDDKAEKCELSVLIDGITKNHGLYQGLHNGKNVILFTGMEGIFEIPVPQSGDEAWTYEKIFDGEVSDVCLYDLDGDGVDELITIEPFHGNVFCIYKMAGGIWDKVYSYPVSFGHIVWAGSILGEPGILLGYRNENGALILMRKRPGKEYSMDITFIDENEGPANISVLPSDRRFTVLCAAGGKHRVVLYELEQD